MPIVRRLQAFAVPTLATALLSGTLAASLYSSTLALGQALPDRADDFAAGELAVIGEVAGSHAGQVDDLHPALLQDRTVGLLIGIERAEPCRISGEEAR